MGWARAGIAGLGWLAACGPQVMLADEGGDAADATTTIRDEPPNPTMPPQPTPVDTTTGSLDDGPITITSGATVPPATTLPPEPTTTGDETTTGGPGPIGADCDVWQQDCPPGQKCVPYSNDGGASWNALGCFPIDPAAVGVGETCTVQGAANSGYDDCELGAYCWDVDTETNEGTCVAQCTGSPASPLCADPNTTCAIANDGVITLCLPICDPLLQDCDADEVCVPVGDAFLCVPDASGDGGAYGDPCANINSCDPGLTCVAAAMLPSCAPGIGCCSLFCDVSVMPDPCPEAGLGAGCQPYFDPGRLPPGGLENVGICSLP